MFSFNHESPVPNSDLFRMGAILGACAFLSGVIAGGKPSKERVLDIAVISFKNLLNMKPETIQQCGFKMGLVNGLMIGLSSFESTEAKLEDRKMVILKFLVYLNLQQLNLTALRILLQSTKNKQ